MNYRTYLEIHQNSINMLSDTLKKRDQLIMDLQVRYSELEVKFFDHLARDIEMSEEDKKDYNDYRNDMLDFIKQTKDMLNELDTKDSTKA